MPEVSINWFTTYHPHYKDKLVGNPMRTFICAVDNFYFLSNFGNFSAVFLLARDGKAAQSGLVAKKREPSRTTLHFFHPDQLSLLFNLTLSEMRLTIYKFLRMSKCAVMTKWELSSTFISFPLLVNYSSVGKLPSEAFFDLFYAN